MINEHDLVASLGIDEKYIKDVTITKEKSTYFVNLKLKDDDCSCPKCGGIPNSIYDYRAIEINSLPIGVDKVIIRLRYPRYKCKYCSNVYKMDTSPITNYKLTNAVLERIKQSFKQMKTYSDIANDFNLTEQKIIRIFDNEIPDLSAPIGIGMCFDEFRNTKLEENFFAFIAVDLFSHKIIKILKSRKKSTLIDFFESIPYEKRLKVQYICCDMYQNYIDLAEYYFPNATIAIDPFHYIRYITNALNNVRIRVLEKPDAPQGLKWLETHARTILMSIENLRKLEKDEKLDYDLEAQVAKCVSYDTDLMIAYHLYQIFIVQQNKVFDIKEGKKLINETIKSFKKSSVSELKDVAKTWSNFRQYIINSFIFVNGVRLANGLIEGTNSRVKVYKKISEGYSNSERFFKRIIYIINSK